MSECVLGCLAGEQCGSLGSIGVANDSWRYAHWTRRLYCVFLYQVAFHSHRSSTGWVAWRRAYLGLITVIINGLTGFQHLRAEFGID